MLTKLTLPFLLSLLVVSCSRENPVTPLSSGPSAASGISAEDWLRKTQVVYGAGQDPFPTSPDDVLQWLREHYREHVEQCPQLIASWREMS